MLTAIATPTAGMKLTGPQKQFITLLLFHIDLKLKKGLSLDREGREQLIELLIKWFPPLELEECHDLLAEYATEHVDRTSVEYKHLPNAVNCLFKFGPTVLRKHAQSEQRNVLRTKKYQSLKNETLAKVELDEECEDTLESSTLDSASMIDDSSSDEGTNDPPATIEGDTIVMMAKTAESNTAVTVSEGKHTTTSISIIESAINKRTRLATEYDDDSAAPRKK